MKILNRQKEQPALATQCYKFAVKGSSESQQLKPTLKESRGGNVILGGEISHEHYLYVTLRKKYAHDSVPNPIHQNTPS